mmetsp:Transcript_121028/g.314317  ORF Transcript_121028/g.314317 Transcript_121028/m.314317 type:complete len:260 (-) Transcript_121028:7-786(-)
MSATPSLLGCRPPCRPVAETSVAIKWQRCWPHRWRGWRRRWRHRWWCWRRRRRRRRCRRGSRGRSRRLGRGAVQTPAAATERLLLLSQAHTRGAIYRAHGRDGSRRGRLCRLHQEDCDGRDDNHCKQGHAHRPHPPAIWHRHLLGYVAAATFPDVVVILHLLVAPTPDTDESPLRPRHRTLGLEAKRLRTATRTSTTAIRTTSCSHAPGGSTGSTNVHAAAGTADDSAPGSAASAEEHRCCNFRAETASPRRGGQDSET